MLNLAFVIQARLGSSRLPCKSALTLGSGRNCVSEVVFRLSAYKAKRNNNFPIFIACPDEERLHFKKLISENSCEIFGGNPEDLSVRFNELVETKGLDGIVRVTGDNPYICFDVLDYLFSNMVVNNFQSVSLYPQKQLPNGTVVSFLDRDFIKLVSEQGCEKSREHLVISDKQTILKNIFSPEIPTHLRWPEGRFCLDNVDDYKYLLSCSNIGDLSSVTQMRQHLPPREFLGEY